MTIEGPKTRSTSSALSPEDWARLESMIDALLDTPPERRAAVLAELSGGDSVRRSELERLIAECERPHELLDQPAAERFAALVDEDTSHASAALADRYEITREIGRGGMATVYLARDIRHSRDVAIKVMRPELAATLGGGRFLREIEIAAGLRHPNIVPVYDSGEAGGILYYVMPYEPGQSLRERLARDGALPIDDAVFILRDVCEALAHAHRHGIVHRDVKPDNVLLSGRHAMVTDFGVAKAIAAASGPRRDTEQRSITTAGVSLGTPAYMAPEQIAADPRIDHRADIYALGVLAYEILAGRPPFQGEEPQLVLAAHLTQTPDPLASYRADVPRVLAELVMKCLEKKPADRWQSADDLLSVLETAAGSAPPVPEVARPLPDRSSEASTSTPTRRRWTGAVAIGTVAVLGFLIFAIDRARREDNAPPLDPNKIVVVPFRVLGVDSSLRYLGEAVVDLLASRLTGEGGPIAVDSRSTISAWNRVRGNQDGTADHARQVARLLGAAEALSGTIVSVPGNRLTMTANVMPTNGSEASGAVTVSGHVDSLPSLLEAIAIRLVAREAGVTEQTLSAISTRSIHALRAYLWGRAEYRRGHQGEAVEHFARAVDIDSSFSLAALDLVVATDQPLAIRSQCQGGPECLPLYFALGHRNVGPETDHRRMTRAFDVAWRHRENLSARDRPLLEALRGDVNPGFSTAREMLADLQRAALAAPDRAETHYLIGALNLHQGPALGFGDSRARAAAAFRRALDLDPGYAAAIAGLVEVAAFEGDTAELRRAGEAYLSRDSVGGAADYVRWRVAAGVGDNAALSSIRERFDALATPTLQRIAHASQMTGVALSDADRAMSLVIRKATDSLERNLALGTAFMHALNRGRPREAARLGRLWHETTSAPGSLLPVSTWMTMATLFWEGDSAVGESAARDRRLRISQLKPIQAQGARRDSVLLSRFVVQQALWDFMHGDTSSAVEAVQWLRLANSHPIGTDFVDALLASVAGRPDAETLRARIDSVTLEGCCTLAIVNWANLIVARAHEAAGRDGDALRAIRRGIWRFPPQLLSTYLREEGRLAAKVGDRAGAIRAYRHYLALRSDPEPELRPQVDRVRAELSRLESGR